MKTLLTFACAAIVLAACNSSETEKKEDTTRTDQANNDGWTRLFDGVSTAGWHNYGGGPAGAAWKVADSAIYLDTSARKDGRVVGGGNLVSDEEYENFDLKLEWKISKGGNSGIIFYTNEDTSKYKEPYETGPEMQVVDNEGHPDGKIEKHKAGDLYDLIACSKMTVKPAGEWNQAEIKSLNGKLDLFLNGENVVSAMMWDDNWKKMIAGSKFKDMPGFGIYKKGHIVLQDHGDMVSYRNIEIKKL
jgi:hypothetical protein